MTATDFPLLSSDSQPPADIAPRQGFLPPVYPLVPVLNDAGAASPELPLFLDLSGVPVEVPPARVSMTWSAEAVRVSVSWRSSELCLRPDLPESDPDFWRQDHVDLRFIPAGGESASRVMLTADGRVQSDCDGVQGHRNGSGVELILPAECLGVEQLTTGMRFRGLVALTAWSNGEACCLSSSATELGFVQSERYGIFEVSEALPVRLRFEGLHPHLDLSGPQPCTGTLHVLIEEGTESERSVSMPLTLTPGSTALPLDLPFGFPLYHRLSFLWSDATGGSHRLGAVSTRLPRRKTEADLPVRSRPGLLFDTASLEEIRSKLLVSPFKEHAPDAGSVDRFLSKSNIPEADQPVSYAFTQDCMGWFRVAKETMLGKGEGGRHPAAVRIWSLQSPEAQEAWREVVRRVGPDEETLSVLLPELNALLARRDLYTPEAFARVRLPREGRTLLERGIDSLSTEDLTRFNRILLQSAVECILAFRMDLLAWPGACYKTWMGSPDPRLIASATAAMRAVGTWTIPDADFHLHEGVASSGIALAYDAFHPQLTEEERQIWRKGMMFCLDVYLESAERRCWTLTTIANSNPVSNSGAGLLALSLGEEAPELAVRVLSQVRVYLQTWLDYCQAPDGGNTEGAQYWQYALENFLPFALAYERVFGEEEGLLSAACIRHAMNMIRVSLCNDGACHGTNDTIPVPIGTSIAWFCASRFGDDFALAYGDHAQRWHADRRRRQEKKPYGPGLYDLLMYRPKRPEVLEPPALPDLFVLHSAEMAMLRSAPRMDAAFTVSVKGARPPYTHHHQTDTGAFSLEYAGERLLLDPGYYKDRASDHSLLEISGHGPQQASGWDGRIFNVRREGDVRRLSVDISRAYPAVRQPVIRHFILVGEEALVIVDEAPPDTRIRFQAGAPVETLPGGSGFRIQGRQTALHAHLFPAPTTLELHPERPLKDIAWGYAFADARWFPVSAVFDENATPPYVTVLTPASGPCSVERQPRALAITLSSGRQLVVNTLS